MLIIILDIMDILPFPLRHLTSSEQQALKMEDGSSGACLIAVARLQHFGDGTPRATMEASENEFVARVGTDGRYTCVSILRDHVT